MGAHGAMFINQNRSPNGTCDHAKQGDDVLFQCSDPGYTTGFASAPHPRSRMIQYVVGSECVGYLTLYAVRVQDELGDEGGAYVRLVRHLRSVIRLARPRHALPRELS